MSYVRFSADSDVYVFAHVNGFIQCCGCRLGDEWDFDSPEGIVEHLKQHVAAGHKVPADLLDPEVFSDFDFQAMCFTFLCRLNEGHAGPHTPVSEKDQEIRDNVEVKKFEQLVREDRNKK